MLVYITKSCLSKGITIVEGEPNADGTFTSYETGVEETFKPKEWYRTEKEARIAAERHRKDVIRSTMRYATKLEGFTFLDPKVTGDTNAA